MTHSADMTLHAQLMAVLDVLNQRRTGYPALVRKGKLRQAEADYRIAAIDAAAGTLSSLYEAQASVTLAPAQVDLFKAWMRRAADERDVARRQDRAAVVKGEFTLSETLISGTEIIAVARLLADLATLARRADLKA